MQHDYVSLLKVDGALDSRVSSFTHALTVVVGSASQINCNQGVYDGGDDVGSKVRGDGGLLS